MTTMKREPQLRFPEFSGEWAEKRLKDVCYIQGGYAFKSDTFSNDGFPIIRIGNIDGVVNLSPDKTVKINKNNVDKKFVVSEGDLLVAMSGATTGKAGIYKCKEKAYLNQRVGLFKIKDEENLAYNFLYGFVETRTYQNQLKNSLVAGAQPNISPTDLEKFRFLTPSLPEQQKIADCLTAMDESIDSQQQKVEQLKAYKKGLLQQIFSQSLRFHGFEGEWEEKRLGECLLKGKAGGTPKTTVKEYYDGNIPFLSISDMTSQGKYINYTEKNISQLGLENSSAWIVPENSVIYSMYASVGFTSINKIKLTTSQAMFSIIADDDLIKTEFLYQYLGYFKDNGLNSYIESGTQGNLKADSIKTFKIPTTSLSEQQKIADCLSVLDELIELESQKLEQLRQYKKGLLQQLFV